MIAFDIFRLLPSSSSLPLILITKVGSQIAYPKINSLASFRNMGATALYAKHIAITLIPTKITSVTTPRPLEVLVLSHALNIFASRRICLILLQRFATIINCGIFLENKNDENLGHNKALIIFIIFVYLNIYSVLMKVRSSICSHCCRLWPRLYTTY